jgi:branched-chain amino acid transport system substrate-binding protein
MRKEEPGVSAHLPWFSKNAVALGAVALSVGVLAACSSSGSSSSSTSTVTTPTAGTSSTAANTSPITIGASLSLTGDFSADGVAYDQGYKLWAADVNKAGGIMGRQVKLTILNDNSDPNQVVTNYETLINTDHVDLTFGPFSSLLTAPASAVAARNGFAFVEGAGGAPTVFDTPSNEADHNVFDVSLPVADEFLPFINYVKSYLAAHPGTKLTAAYPSAQDPFATPPVSLAQTELQRSPTTRARPTTWRRTTRTSWCSAPPTCRPSRRSCRRSSSSTSRRSCSSRRPVPTRARHSLRRSAPATPTA